LNHKKPTILIYGYGNPGRQDDGTGVLLAEKLEEWAHEKGLEEVHTDSNYQLNLEDAASIANYDLVIFADASREEMEDFRLEPLVASGKVEFSMHAVSPSFILHLCREIFNREPDSYLLHIRGYEWEFMGGITVKAGENLGRALHCIQDFILKRLDS
jgi:hydrogenase maturation protease